jgi:hypothetical protein
MWKTSALCPQSVYVFFCELRNDIFSIKVTSLDIRMQIKYI